MQLQDVAYATALGVARTISPWIGGTSKLGRALAGRSASTAHLLDWAQARDRTRPLAWFHGPSVGEGLQARAVLRELRALRPDLHMVFTHTSPSAEGLARSMDVEVADYLPWDGGRPFERLVEALAPDVVVFSQREVWPGVARACDLRDVPVVLAAATLPGDAGRIRALGRWFLRPTFARVRLVLAIAEADAARFALLGVPADRTLVTGDPGIDSAWARARAVDPEAPHLRPFVAEPAPTVVAGSTWPPDEAALLPAMSAVRKALPAVRLVVAPHEPTPAHVEALETALERDGWTVRRLSSVLKKGTLSGAAAVVVDSIGVLADLYTIGTAAVVGGAFDRTGIHSVLEPAAAGLPVTFGPHYQGSRAAIDMAAAGAARTAHTSSDLEEVLRVWLSDRDASHRAGEAGRRYLDGHRGASQRSAVHIAGLLAPSDDG